MPITTTNAVTVSCPEIPFDKLAISLAVSPVFRPDSIGAAVAMTCTPYRVLPEGAIEKLDSASRTVAIGDAFAEAQADPVLAQCVTQIYDALQTYIAAKGL